MWTALFAAANLLALAGWIMLIFLPRRPVALAAVLYLGTGLLSAVYALLLVLLATGLAGGGPDLAALDGWSLQSIRALFASDAALVLGWIHYLAFDLFVGLWIARDADAKRFSRLAQAPVLAATFLAGPLGLFAWLAIRERRARASGRWQ
ncbi:MAG: abscisic acid-deficient protein Aba4 family protein [Pseudomonadota bacterium]|nr:abscisic acid-deficient protein Aba4 family protein [Pseudomonadota bacterium]